MIGGVQSVGDTAKVVDRATGGVCTCDHVPLQSVGRADVPIGCRGSAVGVPRTIPDADHDGGRRDVAFMLGYVQRHTVVAVGCRIECIPHALEVHLAARSEVIAFGRLDIYAMEVREVRA